MSELFPAIENPNPIDETLTAAHIAEQWLARPENLSADRLVEMFRRDGCPLIHRTYFPQAILAAGELKATTEINESAGRERWATIFLRPSTSIHFSLGSPFGFGRRVDNSQPDMVPMVKAKVYDPTDLRDLVPASVGLLVTHPGVMAGHYAIDLNLKTYSGAPREGWDVEVIDPRSDPRDPQTRLDLQDFILLLPKNLVVDSQTGRPLPEGQAYTQESWEANFKLDPDNRLFADGQLMWIRRDDQSFLPAPCHQPIKFGIRSEDYYQPILIKLAETGQPLPKAVYFHEANDPAHGYEEWRQAMGIPEKARPEILRETVSELDQVGTFARASGDFKEFESIGGRERQRAYYWLRRPRDPGSR